jgi:hypothetical protein
MYNVWNTIYPEDVRQTIEHANSVRYAVTSDKVKEQTIVVSEEWQQELASMPFVSKQKGRMSHLLKEKSKVGVYQKERVRYEPFDFASKRKREPAEEKKHGSQLPG